MTPVKRRPLPLAPFLQFPERLAPPPLKPLPLRALLCPLPGHPLPLRAAPPVPASRDRFPLLPLRTHLLPPVPPCRARDPILNPFPLPPPRIVPLPLRAPDLPLLPLVSFRPLRKFQLAPAQPRCLAALRVHPVRDHVHVRLPVPVRHDQRLVPLHPQRLLRCRADSQLQVTPESCSMHRLGFVRLPRGDYRRLREIGGYVFGTKHFGFLEHPTFCLCSNLGRALYHRKALDFAVTFGPGSPRLYCCRGWISTLRRANFRSVFTHASQSSNVKLSTRSNSLTLCVIKVRERATACPAINTS